MSPELEGIIDNAAKVGVKHILVQVEAEYNAALEKIHAIRDEISVAMEVRDGYHRQNEYLRGERGKLEGEIQSRRAELAEIIITLRQMLNSTHKETTDGTQ